MDQRLSDALHANERLRWAVNTLRRRVKHAAGCDLVQTWGQDKTLPCSCGLKNLIDEVKEIVDGTEAN